MTFKRLRDCFLKLTRSMTVLLDEKDILVITALAEKLLTRFLGDETDPFSVKTLKQSSTAVERKKFKQSCRSNLRYCIAKLIVTLNMNIY